jgi:rSAM/selenodomain-associated transferase 2
MLTRNDRPAISIVVPVLDERAMIPQLIATLEPFVGLHELVIVDGESTDGTYDALSARFHGTLLRCERGRAKQMNAGAQAASGHVLLFLHADTSIDHECPELALREIDRGADGGCFAVNIASRHRRLQLAGKLQTARSKLVTSATGDQTIFVRREVFFSLGGFDESLPICEDLDFVDRFTRARGTDRFVCIDHPVTTSGRRWEKNGITRTIALMWSLRLAWHLGAEPRFLSRFYRHVR